MCLGILPVVGNCVARNKEILMEGEDMKFIEGHNAKSLNSWEGWQGLKGGSHGQILD